VKIEVGLQFEILLRTQALAAMAREFASAMGTTSASTLATIVAGVEKRLLKRVEILLYDKHGTDQGLVFFEIDWKAHRTTVGHDSHKQSFEVDITKNISEQIAPVTAIVTSYFMEEASKRGVTRAESIFHWVNKPDQEALSEFRSAHKLKAISDSDREAIARYRGRAESFGDDTFPEASVGGAFRPLN
jgi:hypothetical protein